MNKPTFALGQRIYNAAGEIGEYIADHPEGGIIVAPYVGHQDFDGESTFSAEGVAVWGKAYAEPPRTQLDADIARLSDRATALRAEVRALEDAKRESERDQKEVLARLKEHEALAAVDRYLSGQITHYVSEHNYYPSFEIIPFDKTLSEYSDGNRYRLLTLSPSSGWSKKVVWHLNQYADGSGNSSTRVWPCTSEDEAKQKIAELLAAKVVEFMALPPPQRHYPQHLVACLEKHGLEVPQALAEFVAELMRAGAQAAIEEARKKLAAAEAQLAAISA